MLFIDSKHLDEPEGGWRAAVGFIVQDLDGNAYEAFAIVMWNKRSISINEDSWGVCGDHMPPNPQGLRRGERRNNHGLA